MEAVKVVVLSKNIQLAEELNLLIDAQSNMYCVGITASFDDLSLLDRAQVVVIDQSIYKRDIDFFSDLTTDYPDLKYISLHEDDNFESMYTSLKFGADMCLELSKMESFLPSLIVHMIDGEKVMNTRLAAKVLEDLLHFEEAYNYTNILLEKEVNFLEMFSNNFSRKEIAQKFSLDSKKLNDQIKLIFEKLHKYSKRHIYDTQYA